jgi:DNA-binding NarL/FixJ family response regulator
MFKSASPREVTQAIRDVHAGKRCIPPDVAFQLAQYVAEPELTSRELEVLQNVANGNRNRDIGHLMHISEETVKTHIRSIMQKLGALDRTQAITIAARRGILRF